MRRARPEPAALRRLYALGGGGEQETTLPVRPVRPRPKERPHRRRRVVLVIWTASVVAAAGVLLLLVLPTRTWLAQRSDIAAAQRRLADIHAQNARLEAHVAALQTPTEIARVAREQYNLANPGEQVISVLPIPALTGFPAGWPFDGVRQIVAVRAKTIRR
jgi:cell division protein FtsB